MASGAGSFAPRHLLCGNQFHDPEFFQAAASAEPRSAQRLARCRRIGYQALGREQIRSWRVSHRSAANLRRASQFQSPSAHVVSAGGLQESEGRLLPRLHFKERGHERELMEMWRLALSSYLWVALRKRALMSNLETELLRKALKTQYRREWVIYVSPVMSKAKFLRYAGRYIRRPPIPLSHILGTTDHGVQFLAKDNRAKRMVQLVWPKEMFVDTLGEHIPDHYRHAMRYFGLLAPTEKSNFCDGIFTI